MRIINQYLASLTFLYVSTTGILAVSGQQDLDLYFSLFLIEFLATTLLFTHLHPQAQRMLGKLIYVFFAGFLGIIVKKVLDILL